MASISSSHQYLRRFVVVGAVLPQQQLASSSHRLLFGAATPLLAAIRGQSTDQFHRFLHNPTIIQPDGVDNVPRTKGDQQAWLNTEQWDGYSDTYLQRFMQYPALVEHHNPTITPKNPLLEACLVRVFELYGPAAEELHKLHEDPLSPMFHERIENIKVKRERIAEELDRVYAELHPTVKTLYDAFLVRRYYHLGDWITHVEKKRRMIFERLSPEHLEFLKKAKGISEMHLERLEQLKQVFEQDATIGIPLSLEQRCNEEEMVMIRQKASYYRSLKRYGRNASHGDFSPQ